MTTVDTHDAGASRVAHPPERPAPISELIGRQPELAMMGEVITSVEDGGGALLVRGEAGAGKSSLLRAAAAQAQAAGWLVLQATGIESESALPFAGLHYLLAPLLTDADSLPPVQRRAMMTAFGLQEGPEPELFLIALAALTLLTDKAASCPVVAVVDDLQWLDPPTNDVLAFLARRIDQDPVVIICAVREGHSVAFSATNAHEIELFGLDDASARSVLLTAAPDIGAAERETILAQARGNPLALVELPAAWRSTDRMSVPSAAAVMPLSARLESAFADRITDLPSLTRDAILIAAVDYEDGLAEILAATGVLAGQPVTATVLEPAEGAGLLRFDELRVQFRHPLVRSGIFQHESIRRRQRAHAAMGEVLRSQPFRRTWHRAQAAVGPDDAVADELEANHVESIRRGAIVAAISALERSAQLTTNSRRRGRRLLMAAQHAFGLGRADLVDHLVQAAEQNELSALDQARVEWLREIFNDGAPGDGVRVVELCEVAQQANAADEQDLALDLLLGAGMRCWWADTGVLARSRVVHEAEQIQGGQDDARCIAAIALAEPLLSGRRTMDRLARAGVETTTDADQLRLLGMAARAVGDETRSADFFARAETKLRDQGRLGLLPHVLAVQAAVHADLGDWRRAAESVEEGGRLAAESGQPMWTTGIVVLEARLAALTGDVDKAMQRAAEAELASAASATHDLLACVQIARGSAWLSSGRYADAYAALRPVFDPADPRHHPREQFSAIMFLAEAASRSDQRQDALAVMARMEELARATPSPVLHAQLLYARPVLAGDDDAEQLFIDGLGHDLTRWPWVRARLQLGYGSWLRRQRRVSESREPLRSALTTLELIGAGAWATQARVELMAAGERSDPLDGSDSSARLSAQELQIARLAAGGMSNREIAQQLYLSPRTVSSHLYHIFPKLGIRSRGQLAARMNDLG